MAGQGWEQYQWPALVRTARGEQVERPSPQLMALPDSGAKQQSPNHRMMGWALGLEWLKRWGKGEQDAAVLAGLRKQLEREASNQVQNGIWTIGATSEQFAPDPHAAYWLLPALCFVLDGIPGWKQWWRGTVYAWKAGASPTGEVLLPCCRWAGRFSQVTDACYRNLEGLDHRNNKWGKVSWAQWSGMFDALSGFAAAVEFKRALDGQSDPLGLGDGALEPPMLALATVIQRSGDGLTATMQLRPGINATKPCTTVRAKWNAAGPPEVSIDTQPPPQYAEAARRLDVVSA
ncbi:MAG: hypothetical protein ACRD2T_11245 [Thermoanaerobaculia bacterium]